MKPRIGIFAHSTNPRGGVVHAMHLAEALAEAGEDVTLLAPAIPGVAFVRPPRCESILIPTAPVQGLAEMVARRVADVATFLAAPGAPRFDVHHAQDPITANALARLGCGFVRTVHHLDSFADPRLRDWQDQAVRAAGQLCCVSQLWGQRIAGRFGRVPVCVGNGVDGGRLAAGSGEQDLRSRLGISTGPVFLTLGGVEARKNTLAALQAFLQVRAGVPDAVLVVAGGASLLDHTAYGAAFEALRAASGAAVVRAGVVAEADMPALYRLADAYVCASLEEGFGLCVIEAMAAGTPVIVSDIAPFTEHLHADECLWIDPASPDSIAGAMRLAMEPAIAATLRHRGRRAAARFTWQAVAARHAPVYEAALEGIAIHA